MSHIRGHRNGGAGGPGRDQNNRNGRRHNHPYSSQTQIHMSLSGVGVVNSPDSYTHGPHTTTGGGGHQGGNIEHNHPFSRDVQEHWGKYPGGSHTYIADQEEGGYGYRHTDTRALRRQPAPRGGTGRRQARRTTRGGTRRRRY